MAGVAEQRTSRRRAGGGQLVGLAVQGDDGGALRPQRLGVPAGTAAEVEHACTGEGPVAPLEPVGQLRGQQPVEGCGIVPFVPEPPPELGDPPNAAGAIEPTAGGEGGVSEGHAGRRSWWEGSSESNSERR